MWSWISEKMHAESGEKRALQGLRGLVDCVDSGEEAGGVHRDDTHVVCDMRECAREEIASARDENRAKHETRREDGGLNAPWRVKERKHERRECDGGSQRDEGERRRLEEAPENHFLFYWNEYADKKRVHQESTSRAVPEQ